MTIQNNLQNYCLFIFIITILERKQICNSLRTDNKKYFQNLFFS
jgi:hypothetical protein